MKKLISSILALFLLTSVISVFSISANAASSVKLSDTSITLIVGKSKTLKLQNTNKRVIWSSSKKSIATVNSKGKVIAKKPGKATITAKVSGKKYTCKVNVVKTFKLNNSSVKIIAHKNKSLSYSGGYGKIKWNSSNKKIATVSSYGKVNGLKPGTCTISATRNGVTKKCKVTVQPNFTELYYDYCDFEIAEVASDNSYLELDSDPYNIGDSDDYYDIQEWLYYSDLFDNAVKSIHKDIGLPESLLKRMNQTTFSMGKQTEYYPDKGFSVSWRYYPDYGLKVMYTLDS